MNKKILFTALLVLAGVLGAIAPGSAQQSPPDSERAKQIVALVNKAAQLIESNGKTVQSKGSGWVDYMWPKPGRN